MLLKPTPFINAWLGIAARGLCDEAKARISVEIQAHLAEAVERHQQDGLSPEAALQQAYKELGDPERVHQKFRGTHLTESQMNEVRTIPIYLSGRKPILFLVAMINISIIRPLSSLPLSKMIPIVIVLNVLLLCVITPWVRFMRRQKLGRQNVLWTFSMFASLFSAQLTFVEYSKYLLHGLDIVLVAMWIILGLFFTHRAVRIARKLASQEAQ